MKTTLRERIKYTGWKDKNGDSIYSDSHLEMWCSAPYNPDEPVLIHFRIGKIDNKWYCFGEEMSDADDFLGAIAYKLELITN